MRLGQIAKQCEREQQYMLGDGLCIAACSRHTGNCDALRTGGFEVHAFETGSPLLDQSRPERAHESRIDPEHQRDEYLDRATARQLAVRLDRHDVVLRQTLLQQRSCGGKGVATKEDSHRSSRTLAHRFPTCPATEAMRLLDS